MFKTTTVSCDFAGKPLTIETGKMAKQADGSVLVSYGDTRVLVTVCGAKDPKPGQSFFPLTVEFAERYYAAGKIPGSFFKREGRPTTEATLSARMIDRPIRPLFPEGYLCDVQVVVTVLCVDLEADVDSAASIGASAALCLSDIPFNGPTAGCRVGRIGGQIVVNPSWKDVDTGVSDMDIFITGTANAIMMVEGGAQEVPEEDVLKAILAGHTEVKKVIAIINDLQKKVGKAKRSFTAPTIPTDVKTQVEKLAKAKLMQALKTKDKAERYTLSDDAKDSTVAALVTDDLKKADPAKTAQLEKDVKSYLELLHYNLMREMILGEGARIDGRDSKQIRPITVEAGLLPRTHGSALFTRGETQVLSVVTLGTSDDEQIVDTMFQSSMKKFMLHYNFAPFSVGETGRMGGNSRREIGHGALAERSIRNMMPAYEKFPYTIRIVCETLESNGSSSMGSVCSTSMALMDAGVPYPKPVAGIAMGLIKEESRVAILSDILGDEDHLGDMDFKVAGTKDGITGIQMDIKIEGINEEIMRKAMTQAKEGRLHILGEMSKAIQATRPEMSAFAPRITTIKVPVDKIREVIGSGGKVIREIVATSGAKVDISDDGTVNIASNDSAATQKAIEMITNIIAEVEVGKTYKGIVKKIVEFGAFVGVMPNQDGLLHISEIAHERVGVVTDHLKEGDEIEVKVLEVDKMGKVRLSRKALLPMPEGYSPPPPRDRDDRGGRGGDRGGRGGGGDRGGQRRH